MKQLSKVFLLIGILGFSFLNAQIITKKDTLNGTELSISTNANIANLMEKMEGNCKKTTSTSKTYSPDNEAITIAENKANTPKKKLSTAEICRQNPRIMGYKIQVAVVKSNDEANKLKTTFRQKFPSLKVEVDASLRPNYKILAGSYFTKESAKADLKKIKSTFGSAVPVQYSIFCVDGK